MNLLDVFFPKRCVGCGRVGRYFCYRCKKTIRPIFQNEAICPVCEKPAIDGFTHPRCTGRYEVDGLTSFFRYDGVVKKAIKTIKYRFVSDLASEFVSLIPESSISSLSTLLNTTFRSPLLIPIPLHPSRFRFRGFNQAEKLGNVFAEQLHISIKTDILRRTRETKPQVEMKYRKDRLHNMDGVFAPGSHFDKTPLKQNFVKNGTCGGVIVFDDVFTTGATMRAAANMLKRAGIRYVWGVTMAR